MRPVDATQRTWPPSIDAVWALVAVAIPVIASVLLPTQALDLAYQLRAGEWMLEHRSLLDVDVFTYTVQGEPWLNQQWGAQVALASVHRMGGWLGLDLLRGAISAVVAFLVYRSCRAGGVSARTASLLTIAGAVVGLAFTSTVRPQLFGAVAFAISVWCVATRRAHPARLWLVPVVTVAWANLHGSFPLVLVVMGFAVVEDLVVEGRRAGRSGAVLALSAIATLATPYGVGAWTYIAQVRSHPIVADYMLEWGGPTLASGTGALFFLSAAAIVVLVARRGKPLGWIPLAQLITYGGLSLFALRGVMAWSIAVPIVIAGVLAEDEVAPAREDERSFVNVIVMAALVLLSVIAFVPNRGTDPGSGGPKMLEFAPEALAAALRDVTGSGSHVFASQVHAPWVEWSAPENLYTIDSRLELFPERIWADYAAISEGRDGWDERLEAAEVDALILDHDQAQGLIAALDGDPRWRLVAETPEGQVYARTDVERTV